MTENAAKTLSPEERQKLEAEIMEVCRNKPEIVLATSVLLDVIKVLREKFGWTDDRLHELIQALWDMTEGAETES
ncbi:MAG: hypothetical protein GX493_06225 [Firmicutes bacterium]|nr:hypothetical protein [Bacillota bacterium]